jgi:hypothetical protein
VSRRSEVGRIRPGRVRGGAPDVDSTGFLARRSLSRVGQVGSGRPLSGAITEDTKTAAAAAPSGGGADSSGTPGAPGCPTDWGCRPESPSRRRPREPIRGGVVFPRREAGGPSRPVRHGPQRRIHAAGTTRLGGRGETPARPRAHGEFAARLVGDTTKRASFRCLRGSRRETPRCSHGQHVRPSAA